MSLIKNIHFENNNYKFVSDEYQESENTFSVIIGNNGVGKSRLLSHIIKETWQKSFNDKFTLFENSMTRFSKIIALTSSPFDKFPSKMLFNRYLGINNNIIDDNKYKYLGLKDDRHRFISQNGQFFKIIDSLFNTKNKPRNEIEKLSNTFDLLGYLPKIILIYRRPSSHNILRTILDADNYEDFLGAMGSYNSSRKREFMSKIDNNVDLFYELKQTIEKLLYFFDNQDIYFELDINNGNIVEGPLEFFQPIQLLREYGLVDFKDLLLWRKDQYNQISFKETSSGERALFLNILGIASEIQDNTLVCIDEPEISLHPEWQEKYMQLLITTFHEYRGCHFIIATHSPQIIAKLARNNCFILNMDNNILLPANNYAKRSSDFQLAKLFKAPGFQNEYLMNECLELFTMVSSGVEISDDIIDRIHELSNFTNILSEDDPILKLITTLNKALDVIKHD